MKTLAKLIYNFLRFWVLDLNGGCVAAQSTLSGAMRYYNYHPNHRILVHTGPQFI